MGHSGATLLKVGEDINIITPCGLNKTFQTDKYRSLWMRLHYKNCKVCCQSKTFTINSGDTITQYHK